MNKTFVLLVLALVLASCGGPSATIRYYVIDPIESTAVANLSGKSVQILDLKIPQYLERFQIAKRQSSNQLTFSANQQWGENLRKNLYRTMTRNLSELLNTSDVASAIDRSFSTPDYVIRVSLEAFEQGADGRVIIAARYQISDRQGQVLATEEFDALADRNSSSSYADMVTDLQRLFGELCIDMAGTLKRLDELNAG